jgi:hypothetical protein
MKPSKSAVKLSEMIKQALDDLKITSAEYEQIVALADEDGVIDTQEKRLLAQLHEMIENKTIKRIP